tara:strand:- start:10295 stop:10846 length:552 start_codon:yes stop_codon:yes gene_type:complete
MKIVFIGIIIIFVAIFHTRNIEKFTENSIYSKLLNIHKKIDTLELRASQSNKNYRKHINKIDTENSWMYTYHKIIENPNSPERKGLNKKAKDKMIKDTINNENKIKQALIKKYSKAFNSYVKNNTELNVSSGKKVSGNTLNKYSSTEKSKSNLTGVVKGSSKIVDDDNSKKDLVKSLAFPKFT